ncbi:MULTISPECIES: hypothetical protein [Brevibacillus]|uniref:Uncharacterized protein n=2 Tax=Brevibacillus laterosporus TaxID=1465 RepID=A0AAP3GBK7_BRELA|nr:MULTISPECIES: hypothetical protein [Brevibacillus]AYB38938.1 hypothetical protein D5F52_12015 [Brevibacillus laterosporus]MBG9774392.1 hypothetical protein [Brevibacillus laterosporus]MBG9789937.1 hypothetical protein [Brevibacillus laterosporus]MBG9797896.1 hypothetical protein [Brevibacillus laterosporus]MCR8939015.1 hypothetical protein [Brevibacillus laterosporus]
MKRNGLLIRMDIYNTTGVWILVESEGHKVEDKKKIRHMLFFTGSFGFAVFAMVVVTEIIRVSMH